MRHTAIRLASTANWSNQAFKTGFRRDRQKARSSLG